MEFAGTKQATATAGKYLKFRRDRPFLDLHYEYCCFLSSLSMGERPCEGEGLHDSKALLLFFLLT